MLSIITTCKGRLTYLKATIESMRRQHLAGRHSRVIVVDYDDPERAYAWAVGLNKEHYAERAPVHAVRVEPRPEFNLAHARNCGAAYALSHGWVDVLSFVDADALIHYEWLAHTAGPIVRGEADLVHPRAGGRSHGSLTISGRMFEAIRGYDEGLTGWGCEDNDLHDRACAAGARVATCPGTLISWFEHGDEARTQFYRVQNKDDSWRLNHARMLNGRGKINAHGYGLGLVESFNPES